MKYIAAIMYAVLLLAISMPGQAQSLADIADQEKQRREKIEEAPELITNEKVPEFQGGSISTNSADDNTAPEADSENTEGDSESAGNGEKADPDEPVDFEGRPESYWRDTIAEARQAVKDLENEAQALTLKMNDLQNKFYNISDGFDRDDVQKDIQKTFYEQDLNKENLAKAKDELADLEKEAKKSGAPPGWVK